MGFALVVFYLERMKDVENILLLKKKKERKKMTKKGYKQTEEHINKMIASKIKNGG